MKQLKIFFATMFVALLCLADSEAKVVYVNATAPAGGNGTSWTAACRHLQDALDLTVAGDEVWVAAGTYYPDLGAAVTTDDRTATFTLKQDVRLYGGFAGGETNLIQRNPVTRQTILSGEISTDKLYWSLHVVTLAGSATLDGFTVTKGNANGESSPYNLGAGIYCPVSSKVLTLANCKVLANTANSSGGAIFSYSSVTATNCAFSNNTSRAQGGAICSYSSVTATNCTFSDNTAAPDGGAIFSTGSVLATNCTFSNNTSTSSGGAIKANSVTATNCTFSSNTATTSGGAISCGSVMIRDCMFSNNTVTGPSSGISSWGGGAIRASSVSATNCTFSNNTARSGGGAIFSSSLVTATNCTFSNNKAIDLVDGSGGAIYSSSNTESVTATDCTFSGNTAGKFGGTIYSTSSVTTTDSKFSDNTAGTGGGTIYSTSSVTATNCTFLNNIATSGGGGAIFSGSLVMVTNCIFSNNTATSGGGAIRGNRMTATNSTFSGNTSGSSGGAIDLFSSGAATTTATDCTFSNNTANTGGGAIYFISSSVTVTINVTATACKFSGNTSGSSGGAIHSSFSVTATDCTFSNNTATTATTGTTGGGGAIRANSVTATNCTFSSNMTAYYGGAISSLSTVTTTNSTFSSNTANMGGGAFYADSTNFSYPLTLINCTLVNNLARGTGKKGGAVYARGLVKIFNNIFWHALAEAQDNLIYITSTGSIRNADSEFPSPLNLAKNVIKGGFSAVTVEAGGVVSLGTTSVTLPSTDPLFLNAGNPVGADGIWKTADDGLRLRASSPAVDLGLSMYLPVDTYDLDTDNNKTEQLPVDLAGFARIQRTALDLGAYEEGGSFLPIVIVNQPQSVTILTGSIVTFTVTASGYSLSYQWFTGDSGDTSHPIAGATSNSFTTQELGTNEKYWVRVKNGLVHADSQSATVTIVADLIAAAVNKECNLSFTAGGNGPWFFQSATTYDGVSAAQSAAITHNQSSQMQTTVSGAGTLTFWWRVSSQASNDYLRFYIDDVEQTGRISGTTGTWAQKTFTVTSAGAHTFKWSYTKNGSTSSGSDCGWVDDVVWTPKLITTHPASMNILGGIGANLSVAATGTGLTYQWYSGDSGVVTNPIPGAVASTYTTPALSATAKYWVRVGNGVGYEASNTATLSVSAMGTPLQIWRQTHFGAYDNAGAGADLNDFDHDGIPNLLEFAFGLDPKQNSAGQIPRAQRSGDNFVITFTQPTNVSGVTYGAEWSTALLPGSWTSIPNSSTPPQYTFSVPIESRAKLYMRLKVSAP